eukprot:c19165_g2_i1 orf=1060-2943(+)
MKLPYSAPNTTLHTKSTTPPYITWEESDHTTLTPVVSPSVPSQQLIPATPQPTPWTLGCKTSSFLFPPEPHPLNPGRHTSHTIPSRRLTMEPLHQTNSPLADLPEPTSANEPGSHFSPGCETSCPPALSEDSQPNVPVEPLHQPSLLGPTPAPRQSKGPKVRSLKEIYESSNLSLLLDSSLKPNKALNAFVTDTGSTELHVADAFYLQVLHATATDPTNQGALPLSSEAVDDITMAKALAGPDATLWQQAMDSEYQSLIDNGTWDLVPALASRKLVTCKWLLRKKLHANDTVSRYQARLVARGFSQVPSLDYSETFSPVLRITSFRVLIAIAAQFRLLLHQMDVRTAFLHGDLEEEIYMQQPPGYISSDRPHHVCRLLKSLYGLKQSPCQWYKRFHQCMSSFEYVRFTSDPNIYSRHSVGVFLLLAIYVDDILLLCNSETALTNAKAELSSSFSMSADMGSLHSCLGIQVFQDPSQGMIQINHKSYIISLLKKYDMEACKGMETPLPANLNLKKSELSASIADVPPFPYANILGGVRYLVTCTRPDICFAANLLSRFLQAHGSLHIQYLKRLLRYLQHTKHFGLVYKLAADPLPSPFLAGFSDADWGGDTDTMQSTSGYALILTGAA